MRIQRLLITLLSTLAGGAIALAADLKALVLYNEPPNTYASAIEVVALNPSNPVYSVAILPNGKSQEIPRAGVLAVIDYPPLPPKAVTDAEAAAVIQRIGATAKKYPQFQTKLDSVLTKWNDALAFSRQNAKAAANQGPSTGKGLELEIEGIKYHDVALTSFTGAEVSISHADGIAKFQAAKLSSNQIAALNATNPSVHIDPKRIQASVMPKEISTGSGNNATRDEKTASLPGLAVHPGKDAVNPTETPVAKIENDSDAANVFLKLFSANLPGFELKLNTLCRVFRLERNEVLGDMAGLQLVLEEAGMRPANGDHSKQAIEGAWRCIVWPRIAVEVTKRNDHPLPYKVMLAATLKEHVIYFSTKGEAHPGNETRLLSLLTTLNDREDRRLNTDGASAADKASRVMNVEETITLRDELLETKDKSPGDRVDLKVALVGHSGQGLFETLALDDFFGFAFGKSELHQ